MAIKFGGEFDVQRSPEEVYDFLTNPEKFGPLLPDFKGMSVQDPTHFTVKVNVGVSYIKGTAEVKMALAEAERPRRAKYTGQGSVPGGGANIVAGFDVAGVNGGTKVVWVGEAQVFGKLASIAGGLLEPLGKKNIQKLIDSLQAALTATGAVAAGAVAAPAQAPPDGDVTKLAG
ncbi:MAG TPA: SRPBCC domain-containing protein [Terriglobales bacterium]|nr:SRPBCC domain-containing protein [Terriglobales bacterium]